MTDKGYRPISRTLALYTIVLLIGGSFGFRLFSLQVIKADYYKNQALGEQLKKFEIPASRGQIYMLDGSDVVPVVLNQSQPTLYADPQFVDDPPLTAQKLEEVLGGDTSDYLDLLLVDGQYSVLKKRLTPEEAKAIEELELKGIGLQDATYRVYPEAGLAAQTIGFVNNDGAGQYGIEQYLDEELAGSPGLWNAVTDIRGIPLTTSEDNVVVPARDGDDIVLSLDRQIQQYTQTALKNGVERARAVSASAIVMDPNSGRILAMADYPSYEQDKYYEVSGEEAGRYLNRVVSDGYEAGSVLKPFTMAAALNEGVVSPDTEYYDSGKVTVEDREIENAGETGGLQRTMSEVIQKSINTGVVYTLQQLGGGQINRQARDTLYDYFTNRFGLGSPTGLAQSLEAEGQIFDPTHPEGNNVRYSNMTFGQGMTVSMVQLSAAFSSLVNGGTYYKPYLIEQRVDSNNGEIAQAEPIALREGVISEKTSRQIRNMMKKVVNDGGGRTAKRAGYSIGGKTGTSQVVELDGTYSEDGEVGSFIGFGASEDRVEYVIMIRIDEPKIGEYAGTAAAAPIFADISNFVIDNLQIRPGQ